MTLESHQLNYFEKLFALIDRSICYQSQITTGIDLILTNNKNHFNLSDNFENSFFDLHMLISTTMKCRNVKGPPKKKMCRLNKNFNLYFLIIL